MKEFIDTFAKSQIYQPLTSVTAHKEYLYINNKPINHDPSKHPRSQDLEKFYTLNFAMSVLKTEDMKTHANIIIPTSKFFEISSIESIDIDEPWQLQMSETLYISSMSSNPQLS